MDTLKKKKKTFFLLHDSMIFKCRSIADMNEISIIKHVNGHFVPDEDLNKSGQILLKFNKINI